MGGGLLSEQWFANACAVLDSVVLPDVALVVEYQSVTSVGTVDHHQIFGGGTLRAWAPGRPASSPDVRLRQPLSAQISMFCRTGVGADTASASLLVLDDDSTVPVPPIDEVSSAWGFELPTYPGIGQIVVQQYLTETPFGDILTWFRIVGGPIVDSGTGLAPTHPDIVVQRTYRAALEERAGELDLVESLDGGGIDADDRTLALFVGGYDSDECIELRRRFARPTDESLVRLGEVLSSPGWIDAASTMAGLFAEVESIL